MEARTDNVSVCSQLLQSLTAEEQAKLTRFAERRLAHFGLTLLTKEDLFQQAICSVLNGTDGEGGRKPNADNLASRGAFLNYLRGVISSIAEGWARTYRRIDRNTCSFDPIEAVLVGPVDIRRNVEFEDLKNQLFARLRERAPDHLLPTIEAWERVPDGRIPCVTSRKHVCSVRRLAKGIAIEIGLGTPSGSHLDDTQVAPERI